MRCARGPIPRARPVKKAVAAAELTPPDIMMLFDFLADKGFPIESFDYLNNAFILEGDPTPWSAASAYRWAKQAGFRLV